MGGGIFRGGFAECSAANLGSLRTAAFCLLFLLVDAAVELIWKGFGFHASACERDLVKRAQSQTVLDPVAAVTP